MKMSDSGGVLYVLILLVLILIISAGIAQTVSGSCLRCGPDPVPQVEEHQSDRGESDTVLGEAADAAYPGPDFEMPTIEPPPAPYPAPEKVERYEVCRPREVGNPDTLWDCELYPPAQDIWPTR